MAVSEQTPYQEFIANGTTTVFPLNFDAKEQDHLIVLVDDVEPQVGEWSFDFNTDQVTFLKAPKANSVIKIRRDTPLKRDGSYKTYDNSFRPEPVNEDLDSIWYKLQEMGVLNWMINNDIKDLGAYVDSLNDETKTIFLAMIEKQGISLNQLDTYVNNLYKKLANIAVEKGWLAEFIVDGKLTQKEINTNFRTLTRFYVTPENFYQESDNGDWHRALQTAVLTGLEVKLSDRDYTVSKPLYHRSGLKMTGLGAKVSRIVKTTNAKSGLTNVQAPEGAGSVSYDVDAVLIAYPDQESASYILDVNFSGFSCTKEFGVEGDGKFLEGFGYYAPYIAQSMFYDFRGALTEYGIYTVNIWMTTWIRCEGQGKAGWVIGGLDGDLRRGGTSNTLLSCWSISTREGYYAYNIHNITNSNILSCHAEHIGKNEKPCLGIFNITSCELNITQFCNEVSHSLKIARIRDSNIKIDGISFFQFHNKYGGNTNYLIDIGNSYAELDGIDSTTTQAFMYSSDTANHPNWLSAQYNSVVRYGVRNKLFPRLTGVNNNTGFQLMHDLTSNVKFETQGYIYERANGTNTTMPSVTTKVYDTDLAIKTQRGLSSATNLPTQDFGLINNGAFLWDSTLMQLGQIYCWFSPTYGRIFWKQGAKPTSEIDGNVWGRELSNAGASASRPSGVLRYTGKYYFDSTLNKPIWFNGTNWTDANGTVV